MEKHICEFCGDSFDKSVQLKKHKLEYHSDEISVVPLSTNQITEEQKPPSTLNTAVPDTTSIKDEEDEFKEESDNDDDPDFEVGDEENAGKTRSSKKRGGDTNGFECVDCHKFLSSYKGLQVHRRRHTGKNLAQCYVSKRFFFIIC